MFLRILEFASVFLTVYLMVTQVTIPLFTGRIIFPVFRPARRKLEKDLANHLEAQDLESLKNIMKGPVDDSRPKV